eukprot:2432255-Prymnesium_polylepis.1
MSRSRSSRSKLLGGMSPHAPPAPPGEGSQPHQRETAHPRFVAAALNVMSQPSLSVTASSAHGAPSSERVSSSDENIVGS